MYQSAQQFLNDYPPNAAGCLLLDLRLNQGMTGDELQSLLVQRGVGLPIIIITGHADVPTAVKTLGLGAFRFLEKPIDGEELLACINDALQLDADNREAIEARNDYDELFGRLTPREEQVLHLVVEGHANRAIGEILGVTTKTIEAHRAHIMQKLEVNNLAGLITLVFWYRALCNPDRNLPGKPPKGNNNPPPEATRS